MKRASFSTLFPLFLFAACSGDGGYTVPDNDPVPTGFAITPTNGAQVAQTAYQSVVTSGDFAGLAGNTGLSASVDAGLTKPTIESQLGGIIGGVVQAVPLPPIPSDCIGGGTVTYTFDVVDVLVFATGMLSAGDQILIEYVNCGEASGEVIDGTIDAIVDAISGDLLAGALDITMTMDLINFQVTIGTDVLLSNGDATASLDNTVQLVASASVSGSSMTTDTNTGSETLTNYASAQTVDANFDPAPYTMAASGTLDSSQLDGVVDYSTPVMFQGFDANYPSSGELLVSSTDSSARLIAVDDVDVRIEIYSNATGTGTPDSTILTTWAALAAM